MAYNNWHVAGRVRKTGWWSKIPIVGTWLGINLSTTQVKYGALGSLITLAILSQYPASDWFGMLVTAILLLTLTVYFVLPEPEKYAPEKIRGQVFLQSLFKIGEVSAYRPLRPEDLKRGGE
ncbi:hypothetical protein K1728_06510 [Weissella confusa]|uniref:hypothetical protein n=1 Tax=Weissella confusa TaxID=1583 RepID=UPI001C6F8986|nr:hypothetical protein [Weissella confusa]QYU56729.1 hypothetical protein K1728_05905 [Weissella confusa]QYU56843.1 hypothetical protein K1728_06510 [Weissella confusa]